MQAVVDEQCAQFGQLGGAFDHAVVSQGRRRTARAIPAIQLRALFMR
jgi:hypothetical protein